MFAFLRRIIEENGFDDIPASVLRNALEKLYSIWNRNWYPEDDAVSP